VSTSEEETNNARDCGARLETGSRLDSYFLTIFIAVGYAIAVATGSTTSGGFELNGGSAFLLFAMIAGYFFAGRR